MRVLEELAAEDRALLVRRLEREEQVEQRERDEAHRAGDGLAVVVLGPAMTARVATAMTMPTNDEPEEQRARAGSAGPWAAGGCSIRPSRGSP